MELSEFKSDYLTNLVDTLSSKNKTVILFTGFHADLLKYGQKNYISAQLVLQQHQQLS